MYPALSRTTEVNLRAAFWSDPSNAALLADKDYFGCDA